MNDENKTPTGANPPPAMDPIQPPASNPAPPQPAPPPLQATPAPVPTANPLESGGAQAKQDLADLMGSNPTTAPTEPQETTSGTLSNVGRGFLAILGGIFSWIIFPLFVVLILHNFVFQAYHVLGTSMNPTLQQTDYLIISKVGYTEALVGRLVGKKDLYLPARGQIIVFHYPKDTTEIFVKRVIGRPGDRIVIKGGAVTVYTKDNPAGYNPDSKYEPAGTTTLSNTESGVLDETVQPGNVFVMGDNRTPGGSYDSREWGELPSNDIIGNAVLRLLPLDAVKVL